MLIGGTFAPYPISCGGLDCFSGNEYQHSRIGDYSIPRRDSTIRVAQWHPCDGTTPIIPYERCSTELNGDGDMTCPGNYTCADSSTVAPDCIPWTPGTAARQFTMVQGYDISAPLTSSGGGYATSQQLIHVAVANGGEGYAQGDVLGVIGGTLLLFAASEAGCGSNPGTTAAAQIMVASVDENGTVLAATVQAGGVYSANPTSPNSPTDRTTAAPGTPGFSQASFTLTFGGSTVNYGVCEKTGWKGVKAHLQWNGTFPFSNGQTCPNTPCYDLDGNFVGSYLSYQPTPYQTHYLNLSWSFVYSCESYSPGYTVSTDTSTVWDCSATGSATITVAGTNSVNPNSGEQVGSGLTNSTDIIYSFAGYSYALPVSPGGPRDADFYYLEFSGTPAEFAVAGETQFLLGPPDPVGAIVTGNGGWKDFLLSASPCGGQVGLSPTENGVALLWGDFLSANPQYGWNDAEALAAFLSQVDTANISGDATITGSASLSDTSLSCAYGVSVTQTGPYPDTWDSSIDFSLTLSNAWTASQLLASGEGLLNYWNLADDQQYPWRRDGNLASTPLVSFLQLGGEVSPEIILTPTMNDMTSPVSDSEGNAPYTSNDPSVTAPWTYVPTNPGTWNPTYDQIAWKDPAVWYWNYVGGDFDGNVAVELVQMFDGSVQGAPNPAGFVDYFNFAFTDWRSDAISDEPGSYEFYAYGYGMWLSSFIQQTGSGIPPNATQWTNNLETVTHPPGASICYGNDGIVVNGTSATGGLWLTKYAEIKENWQAQNYARPAGNDKFIYDECDSNEISKVYAATNVSGSGAGSVWALLDYNSNIPTAAGRIPTGGDYWGGTPVGGFYAIAGYNTSTGYVTLGALYANLPSDWSGRSVSGDDAQAFGKLRWPTYPSLLGRVEISMSGLTATFGTAQTNFGMLASGTETVDIMDAVGTVLATGITATRVDDTHFTLPTNYPTARYCLITGAPEWYFNTNFPRGNFVALEWTHDYRTNLEVYRLATVTDCDGNEPPSGTPSGNYGYSAFSQTQYCLPFCTGSPRVICWSPNGETFKNGITLGFPSVPLDHDYGTRWQASAQTVMTDLLWQKPHTPLSAIDPLTDDEVSGSDITWTMDNGTCQADSSPTFYYPLAPQVECENVIPDYGPLPQTVQPTLPSGITNSWLSPVTNSNGVQAPGPIGFDPSTGMPGGISGEWVLRANIKSACADGSTCRFLGAYSAWFVP